MLLVMPAASLPAPGEQQAGGLGAKLVTYYPRNRERGQPTHLATYVLMHHATGKPLALLEASYLTALRTGATSALAARHLARPDSRRVACFGTSVQARQQLRCLAAVFTLERVVVLGRDAERARRFAQAMAEELAPHRDRKSTRLNSSHGYISHAGFCLRKKTRRTRQGKGPRCHPHELSRSN